MWGRLDVKEGGKEGALNRVEQYVRVRGSASRSLMGHVVFSMF